MSDRFCRLPAHLLGEREGQLCQWPRDHVVTWHVNPAGGQLPDDEIVMTFGVAWAAWQEVSGLRARQVQRPQGANCVIDFGRIDGPFGILAWAELPCGSASNTRLRSRFDSGDRWAICDQCPSGKIDLLRVAIHEIGHLIGLGHEQDPSVPSIMDPSLSDVRSLQPWEIGQAVDRYGPAGGEPPPPEPPDDGDGGKDKSNCVLIEALERLLERRGER